MHGQSKHNEETPLKEIKAEEGWEQLRWVPFAACMILMFCSGSSYGVSLFTGDLKTRFFNDTDGQAQIQNLAFYANLGQWFPLGGFFLDSPFGGLKNTAIFGALMMFIGFGGMAAWSGYVINPGRGAVGFLFFSYGMGCGMCDVAAVTNTAYNFPNQRGTALGLIKAILGLCSAVMAQIYTLFFAGQTTHFIIFLATVQPVLVLVVQRYMARIPIAAHKDNDDVDRRLHFGIKVVLGLASMILVVSGLKQVPGAHPKMLAWVLFTAAIITAGLLSTLLRGPARARDESFVYKVEFKGPAESKTLIEAVQTPEFYLLFFTGIVCTGSGLTLNNNVAQMVPADGGSSQAEAVLVAIISAMSCIGRISFGLVPDMLHEKISRQSFLMINCAIGTCGHLLSAIGSMYTLFPGAALAGLAYGGYFSLMPALIIEYFGLKNFASIASSITMSACISSLSFSMHLASFLYDQQALLEGSTSNTCTGRNCWMGLFFCLAGLLSVGVGLGAAQLVLVRHREKAHHV